MFSKSRSPLNVLSAEASSLLDQAKRYRVEMNELPEGDSRRDVYERMIRDLLDRSNRLSSAVSSTASSSN